MSLFVWKEIYSVGNPQIDEQHQKLFEIANRFSRAYDENTGSESLTSIFEELLAYTQFHFRDEEALMKKCGFPDFDKHRANHDKLINVVLSLKKNFEAGEDGIEERIMEFLKMWLNGHILGMDRSYRSHVTSDCHL